MWIKMSLLLHLVLLCVSQTFVLLMPVMPIKYALWGCPECRITYNGCFFWIVFWYVSLSVYLFLQYWNVQMVVILLWLFALPAAVTKNVEMYHFNNILDFLQLYNINDTWGLYSSILPAISMDATWTNTMYSDNDDTWGL
mgnify:CR=1 FL=1